MAHRTVRDSVGHDWDVWEVHPTLAGQTPIGTGVKGRVSQRLAAGWLAFQSAHEKRRLAPVPDGWEAMSDEEILALLERAPKAGKPSRLIE
jgi:hypothetical protein